MHELSLVANILDIVEAAERRERFPAVRCLKLAVGKLSGIEIPALTFALEVMMPGTVLAGARIEIDEPPGEILCLECGRAAHIAARGDPCPHCGGFRLRITGGAELRVVELIVAD
ncbi:MAG: hydrogenase maturation nickel metallochaperone HypA [Betaproteobacteria bacterium]|nr:hydrogenase maturation nickel metallochaperone HypA [Betaproteobacteria bacterium]